MGPDWRATGVKPTANRCAAPATYPLLAALKPWVCLAQPGTFLQHSLGPRRLPQSQSNATLPELQNTAQMPPDDWARQLRAYNSLRDWRTLPALLLLSNRLGERYNRKRRLDPDTPLLADVKNLLLYACHVHSSALPRADEGGLRPPV